MKILVVGGGVFLAVRLVKKNREKQRRDMEGYDEDL